MTNKQEKMKMSYNVSLQELLKALRDCERDWYKHEKNEFLRVLSDEKKYMTMLKRTRKFQNKIIVIVEEIENFSHFSSIE